MRKGQNHNLKRKAYQNRIAVKMRSLLQSINQIIQKHTTLQLRGTPVLKRAMENLISKILFKKVRKKSKHKNL